MFYEVKVNKLYLSLVEFAAHLRCKGCVTSDHGNFCGDDCSKQRCLI